MEFHVPRRRRSGLDTPTKVSLEEMWKEAKRIKRRHDLGPKVDALDNNLDFGLKASIYALSKQVSSLQKNTACSPFSISAMLNKLAAGAKGEALQEVLNTLQCKTLEEINEIVPLLMNIAKPSTSDTGPKLSFANGSWFDPKFGLDPSYLELLQNVHQSHAVITDFSKRDELVNDVNSWVKEKTQGFITEILSPSDIKRDTAMILVDALYFKGIWRKPFKASLTKVLPFHLLDGQTVQVPFMREHYNIYGYGSFKDCKVLKMDYRLDREFDNTNSSVSRWFSMYILLPDQINGLQKLIEDINLNMRTFEEEINCKSVNIRNLSIPKFDFTSLIRTHEVLRDLGLKALFDTDTEAEGVGFGVSDIIQKCRIRVDEKGTEVAVVTQGLGVMASRNYVDFIADHPFMFVIREDRLGTIFFVGTVLNPSTS